MKNKKLIKGYGKLALRAILFLLLVVVFFTKVLFFARVEGMQMFPSLKDGDLALGYALAKDYRPGDVVVYEADGKQCFGRILTLAGNEVDIDGSGDVKVNGISESNAHLSLPGRAGKRFYTGRLPDREQGQQNLRAGFSNQDQR